MGREDRLVSIMAFGLVVACCMAVGHSRDAAAQAAPAPGALPSQSAGRSWLGVELSPVPQGGRGVPIRHVVRGSPAQAAGLRDGDAVLRVGSVPVASPDEVIRAISVHEVGAAVRVFALRAGADLAVDVTLGRFPGGGEMLRLDKIGARAPGFEHLAAVAGQAPASLDDLRGKVVLIDFWMASCAACRFTAPRLSALQAKLGAEGLAVIGITDEPVADAARAAASFGMRFAVLTDESFATQRAFGVTAFPTVFVVDRRGVIRDVFVGFDPRNDRAMEALLEKLLAEPAR
jgi:peroxiredoxin